MLLKARAKAVYTIFSFIAVSTILFLNSVFAGTIILSQGKTPFEEDSSYKISFKDPMGFEEDKSTAENSGLIKLYIPKGKKIEESFMIITVALKKKSTSKFANLDSFIKHDVDNYKILYKDSKIDIAQLPEDITRIFKTDNIPFLSVLFKSNSSKTIADAIVLFFETPDGFWSITYTAPEETRYETRDVFLKFIKDIEIVKK